jgi:hypothetical protein
VGRRSASWGFAHAVALGRKAKTKENATGAKDAKVRNGVGGRLGKQIRFEDDRKKGKSTAKAAFWRAGAYR